MHRRASATFLTNSSDLGQKTKVDGPKHFGRARVPWRTDFVSTRGDASPNAKGAGPPHDLGRSCAQTPMGQRSANVRESRGTRQENMVLGHRAAGSGTASQTGALTSKRARGGDELTPTSGSQYGWPAHVG